MNNLTNRPVNKPLKCRYTTSIGAHLLGALGPDESMELERHYRTCPHCRDEVVRLAPLPGLLHRVSPKEAPPAPAAPPPRHRPRRLHIAAVALVLVAAGVAAFLTGKGTSGSAAADATVSWSHTVAATPGMRVTADLTEQPWGTQIRLRLSDPPPGRLCHLVVFTREGEQQTTGWWTTGYDTDADIMTSTSVPIAELTRLAVLDPAGTALARITR